MVRVVVFLKTSRVGDLVEVQLAEGNQSEIDEVQVGEIAMGNQAN